MCYLFYMFLNTWSGRTGIPSMETSFWNPPSIESGALETCCFLLWPWFSQKRKKKLDCHHLGIWVNPSLEDNPKLRQIQLHSVLLSLTGGFSNRRAGLKSCQIWPFFVVCVCVCMCVCVGGLLSLTKVWRKRFCSISLWMGWKHFPERSARQSREFI